MKNQIFTFFFMFLVIAHCLDAQTWQGSGITTGLTYRDGNVLIGSTTLSGSFASDRVLQVKGNNSLLTLYSSAYSGHFLVAFYPQWGYAGFISDQHPVKFTIGGSERMSMLTNGNIGIGSTNPAYKLEVNGIVGATGYQTFSDLRFKQNIQKITGSFDKISEISGYTYFFNLDKFKDKNFPQGEQMGVLAQEIQKIFPHSVMQDGEGYLSVDYISLIPVMIQAIKELKTQVDEMRSTQLTTLLTNHVGDPELYRGAYLNQNTPNPFNSQTSIEYTIPDNAYSANIIVHDLSGKQVKRIEITHKGSGSIDIASEDLPPGFYLYSLVLDGKPILIKKMIQSD